MTTLREELEALADKCELPRPMALDAIVNRDRALAIAAANLALEAAAKLVEDAPIRVTPTFPEDAEAAKMMEYFANSPRIREGLASAIRAMRVVVTFLPPADVVRLTGGRTP